MFFPLSFLLHVACASVNTEENAADQTGGDVPQRNMPIHLHQVSDAKPEYRVRGKKVEITFDDDDEKLCHMTMGQKTHGAISRLGPGGGLNVFFPYHLVNTANHQKYWLLLPFVKDKFGNFNCLSFFWRYPNRKNWPTYF